MKTKLNTHRYIILILLFTLNSCDNNGLSNEFNTKEFRELQLKNIYESEISILSSSFIIKATNLRVSSQEFKTNTTIENYEDLKNQWKELLKIWKLLEMYNFGQISDSFIHFKINSWPSNTAFINNYINGYEQISDEFIETIGSSSKGISAIEYLLFLDDTTTSIEKFTIAPNASRRLDYLVSTCLNLETMAKDLNQLWQSYNPTFISNLENGIDGSHNMVINAMVSILEEIIITKLGKPLGENGASVHLEKLEAKYSNTSLLIIKQHLLSLKRCFTGDFSQTNSELGFEYHLNSIGYQNLSNSILNKFDDCENTIENIGTDGLKDELINNHQRVVELRNKLRELLVLIKVDMSSVLDATITFNDTDGD